MYYEWVSEHKDGYDLIVFVNFKLTFLTKLKKKGIKFKNIKTAQDFILILAKKPLEIGKYFHCETGPAYGAAYKSHQGKVDYKHEEYWLNGKRVLNKKKIEAIKNKTGVKKYV